MLADLARSALRKKLPSLEEAFTGRFDDHHAFLLARMLARVDAIDADLAAIDQEVERHLAPFAPAIGQLDEVPGIGPVAAAAIIAEIGVDMTRFPTPAHLCSWAKFAPGVKSSAGRTKGSGATVHGNKYLARTLGEVAVNAGRTNTFLGARYRRIARRRGSGERWSPSAEASSSSSGTCCQTQTPTSSTSAPTTTINAATLKPSSVITSANSKPSATT